MDKELEKKVRDQIATDVNNMINNKLRKVAKPYPMLAQVKLAGLLAEARKACMFSSIPFNHWIRDNLKGLRYEECKRLASAGESGNAAKYIKMRREVNRRTNVLYRKRERKARNNAEFVKNRFDRLKPKQKKQFLKLLCEEFPPFKGYDDEAAKSIEYLTGG